MEDGMLLVAIARGSKTAFQLYYERHAGRLLGYVLRVTRDRREVADERPHASQRVGLTPH
jgi:RNA polymerase sigma-70 factor, ECF subfamily